ncbi:MAG: hypothetical protein ACX98W_17920 [bacterium]
MSARALGSRPWILCFLIGLALGPGCRTTPPTAVPFSAGVPLAIADARAERVLDRHLSIAATRPALRGLARVSLEGPDFKLNRPQRIAVARPARLRFEVLGLFDQLAGLLVTDGRQFGYFDASQGAVTRGRMTPRLLWDLARIDLEAHEVVELLLGVPTPSPGTARAGVWLEAEGRIAVAFAWPASPNGRPAACLTDVERATFDPACFLAPDAIGESGGEIFFFGPEGRLRELRVLEPAGEIRFRALFADYASLPSAAVELVEADETPGAGEFANRLTILSPRIGAEARFLWKRVMLTDGLSDRFFEIPRRDGEERDG